MTNPSGITFEKFLLKLNTPGAMINIIKKEFSRFNISRGLASLTHR
jgi:hypothetical protein